VSRYHGALLKTMGDAIMAVFSDPLNAIEASQYVLERLNDYNSQNPPIKLILKMGIHQGACIAVTLNERLDYFGSVVNLAARLQGQSTGDDVVISEAVYHDPAVQQLLEHKGAPIEPVTATFKGFEGDIMVYRLKAGKQR
jgi:class 3 adenylate cyclase